MELVLKIELVVSLIKTLEYYNQYTSGHSNEVAEISLAIAQRMYLSQQDQYDIYWAGIVHDIGKVGIPISIINKPGRLTNEEFNQVKNHSIFGADILKASSELEHISILVRHHHEWWNGKGYPDGLKEDQIPLGSQILCIADSISVMLGERPYSVKKSLQEVMDELEKYSSIQFSPLPAKAAIDLINEGIIKKTYKKIQQENRTKIKETPL